MLFSNFFTHNVYTIFTFLHDTCSQFVCATSRVVAQHVRVYDAQLLPVVLNR